MEPLEAGPNWRRWRDRKREQGSFLSYWVAADWSLPLSPSGGACGVRVPGDPNVCPILSGDELWLIPIWVSPAALMEPSPTCSINTRALLP